jgi:hypothetical protein
MVTDKQWISLECVKCLVAENTLAYSRHKGLKLHPKVVPFYAFEISKKWYIQVGFP